MRRRLEHRPPARADHDATAATARRLPDVAPVAADFVNINTMARVGDHFVGSLNGHLAASLAVARSAKGGVYPVGTVIQLLPTEAMVKRHKGYSPSTDDWEFFSLAVSPKGTEIAELGHASEEISGRRLRVVSRGRGFALRLRLREEPRMRAAPADRRAASRASNAATLAQSVEADCQASMTVRAHA